MSPKPSYSSTCFSVGAQFVGASSSPQTQYHRLLQRERRERTTIRLIRAQFVSLATLGGRSIRRRSASCCPGVQVQGMAVILNKRERETGGERGGSENIVLRHSELCQTSGFCMLLTIDRNRSLCVPCAYDVHTNLHSSEEVNWRSRSCRLRSSSIRTMNVGAGLTAVKQY